jgi:hypothetical protein
VSAGLEELAERIAATVYSADGRIKHLRCARCRRIEQLDEVQAAEYFEHGWPRCCGETMMLKPAGAAGG